MVYKDEEKMEKASHISYKEYKQKVKYRMIPFIWWRYEDRILFFKELHKNATLKIICGADHRFKNSGETEAVINFTTEFLDIWPWRQFCRRFFILNSYLTYDKI